MGPKKKKVTFLQFLFSGGACSGHSEIRGDESQKSERKKLQKEIRGNFCWYIICPGGQETQRL